ncbi:hypothetical protein niasHT_035345 [Heterodera trifolii]|uniref:Protein-tyrosine phosphatase n=1 Tax=Heterodera trifolii TaxID=157864 RepID=A0ABD2HXK6_9BILA
MSGAGSGRQKRGQTEAPRRPTRRQSTQRPRQAGTQQQPGRATTTQEQSVLAEAPTLRRWEDTAEFFFALERFVNDTTPRTVQDLVSEFTELNAAPRPEPSPEFTRNLECNRYRDVICTEINRVRLHSGRYIHANWISTFGENRFICTQGPLETTCDDFWTMIVQENIEGIVMLCDTIEQNRIKCHQYWPTADNKLMRFANNQIMVKFSREHHVEGALYRTDLIVGAPQMRQGHLRVQHFHWRQWPDRGVPHSDLAPLRLLYHVIGVPRAVVHCSAGIGRTGTLVAVYLANQTLHLGQPLNIFALIRDLRRQRSQSIQTLDQYLYIYFVILRYAQNKASKLNINVNALNALVQALNSTMRRG